MPSYVGERLRAARLSMGVTGHRLAQATRVPLSTVYWAEMSESQPSTELIETIMAGLGKIAEEDRERKIALAASLMRAGRDLLRQVEDEVACTPPAEDPSNQKITSSKRK